MKTMNKVVIKVGTSSLLQGSSKLCRRYMLGLVQQIVYLHTKGVKLALVTSGAVATGREIFACTGPSKQTFASIGQIKLMQVWFELFSLFDLQIGQVLLTKENFVNPQRDLTQSALSSLLQHRVVPVINENITVETVGDNDSLAASVAALIGADSVILLTDQDGLYTADPRLNADAKLIPFIEHIDDTVYAFAGGSSTPLGIGGMKTKIQAAKIASMSGVQTIITSSNRPNVLIELFEGKQVGTRVIDKAMKQETNK